MARPRVVITLLFLLASATVPGAAHAGMLPDLPGMDVATEVVAPPTPSADAAPEPDAGATVATGEEPDPEPAASEPEPSAAPEAEPPATALDVAWRIMYSHGGGIQPSSLGSLRDCPAAATCDAYRLGRSRWPTDSSGGVTVSYRYNDIGRPASAPDASTVRSLLNASAAEWMRWNPSLSLVDGGTTTAAFNAVGPDGDCDDDVNVVTWRAFPAEVLGAAAICYDTRTYEVRDVDTALNAALRWANFSAATEGTTAFDVRSILTHEIGHWFALMDLRFRHQSAQTMYAAALPGEIRKRTLALGDVLGVQAAYPCGSCSASGVMDD